MAYLTVVYRDIAPGSEEIKDLVYHPKLTACSWSHALHDLEDLRRLENKSQGHSRRLNAEDVEKFLSQYQTKEEALGLLQDMGFVDKDGNLASPYRSVEDA